MHKAAPEHQAPFKLNCVESSLPALSVVILIPHHMDHCITYLATVTCSTNHPVITDVGCSCRKHFYSDHNGNLLIKQPPRASAANMML